MSEEQAIKAAPDDEPKAAAKAVTQETWSNIAYGALIGGAAGAAASAAADKAGASGNEPDMDAVKLGRIASQVVGAAIAGAVTGAAATRAGKAAEAAVEPARPHTSLPELKIQLDSKDRIHPIDREYMQKPTAFWIEKSELLAPFKPADQSNSPRVGMYDQIRRHEIVERMLRDAADPQSINQGRPPFEMLRLSPEDRVKFDALRNAAWTPETEKQFMDFLKKGYGLNKPHEKK
jgi:hypothetical protein